MSDPTEDTPTFSLEPTCATRRFPPLSLRQNFSWTFAGNMVYAASQWAMLMVLSKVGTDEMVGQFNLGLAICAPVIMFSNLQLRSVQATDARDEYRFGDYLGLRLIATALSLIAIVVILLMRSDSSESAVVILLIGVAKASEAVSDIIFGLLQKHERMDLIARSLMMKGPISLLVLGIIVVLTGEIVLAVGAMAASWMVVLFSYDLPIGARLLADRDGSVSDEPERLRPEWDSGVFAQLAWLALPLGIVMMLISLNSNVPKYFIEHHLGTAAVGYFGNMAYVMVAGDKVVAALGRSAVPRLSRLYVEGRARQFGRLVLKLLGFGLVIGVVGLAIAWLLGPEILTSIYNPRYAEYGTEFLVVTLAGALGFLASFLGYAMTAARYFRCQVPLFMAVSGASLLTSYLLIPEYGLLGACWALVAGLGTQLVGSAIIVGHALYRLRRKGEQGVA